MSVYFANSSDGKFQSYALSPPMHILPGDVVNQIGDLVQQVRGGIVHQEWNLSSPVDAAPSEFTASQTINSFIVFRERPMPPSAATLISVTVSSTGEPTFEFSDGTGMPFPTWADVGGVADTIDADATLAKRILVAKSFRNSPDGANMTTMVGQTVTCDCNAATPIQFSE